MDWIAGPKENVFADAPFEKCHASSFHQSPSSCHCVAFAGPFEMSPQTAIWLSSRRDGQWNKARVIADVGHEAHWNPVIFEHNDRLMVIFKVGRDPRHWRSYITESHDDAHTWSPPRELVTGDKGGRGPVRAKPLWTSAGQWLAGASIETDFHWDSFIDASSDGLHWQRSPYIPYPHDQDKGRGMIQPSLWESEPGQLHMLARGNTGSIMRSDSSDHGKSWCQAYATDRPNNNSGIDVIALPSGALILASNPVSDTWGARTPLSLDMSLDNGKTWSRLTDLESGEGEFSYPTLMTTANGWAITYTQQRSAIIYQSFLVRKQARH